MPRAVTRMCAAMPRVLAIVAVLSAAPALAQGAAAGRVVEEVVAVVKTPAVGQTRVITLTRLEEEARIALVSRGAVEAASGPLDGSALKAALEWLLDQVVILDEVTRLQVFEVDRADVLAELERFRAHFAREADYRAFLARADLTEEELAAALRRMLRVQRYLDSRVRLAARVKDAEVEAYWRAHEADFAHRSFADVKEAVRAHLAEEKTRAEVKSIVAELRGRAEIRVLERFEG